MSASPPESFVCPLTLEVMEDPVIDPEGNSFERVAIEEWVARNGTSPVTRTPLTLAQLAPNRALKELITERWHSHDSSVTAGAGGASVSAATETPAAPVASTSTPSTSAPSSGVTVSLHSSCIIPTEEADTSIIHSTVIPSDNTDARDPVDVCCVVDVSGSMGAEAKMRNAGGDVESHGLSLLDVVKHAVKTVIHTLKSTDKFSLVAFSNTARVVTQLTAITPANKDKLLKAVDSLGPEGTTNLWDGLHKGMELLRMNSSGGRIGALMLLTDGLPNVEPPRGHIPMMRLYKEKNVTLPCSVSTFGFGYSLDSDLLDGLAMEGSGQYSFIPDASFVGTVFVHALANILATCAKSATLAIEMDDLSGVKLTGEDGVLGGYDYESTSWGVLVRLGNLQLGQPRDVVLRLKGTPITPITVTLQYKRTGADKPISVTETCAGVDSTGATGTDAPILSELWVQRARLALIDHVRSALGFAMVSDMKSARSSVDRVVAYLRELKAKVPEDVLAPLPGVVKPSVRLAALLTDCQGQIAEAVSRDDWFNRWGQHFLRSIGRAHFLQQCNNFKDPGVQHYGGSLFKRLRDDADELFCKLPPPTPSVSAHHTVYRSMAKGSAASSSRRLASGGSVVRNVAARPAVDMRSFHNSSNACFAGHCQVMLADGTTKHASAVRKGDRLLSPGACKSTATVLAVLKTLCQDGKMQLCEIKETGLQLTPYHPIHVNGKWTFPIDVTSAKEVQCEAVYSFALEKAADGSQPHSVVVDAVQAVSLAHGLHGDVVSHAFFGTSRVLEAMQKFPGWDDGVVVMPPNSCVRDAVTMDIVGFRQTTVAE